MRFDLTTDIAVDLAYAKINLAQGAERARNNLRHPSARTDKLAAFHEAQRFIDNRGTLRVNDPGHWVSAEVLAHSLAGIRVTPLEAASKIVAEHDAWELKATAIALIVRTTELRLQAATTPKEVHDIITRVRWPAAQGDLS